MKKLSELEPKTFVDCDNEVMFAEKAIELAKKGKVKKVFLVTDDCIISISGAIQGDNSIFAKISLYVMSFGSLILGLTAPVYHNMEKESVINEGKEVQK